MMETLILGKRHDDHSRPLVDNPDPKRFCTHSPIQLEDPIVPRVGMKFILPQFVGKNIISQTENDLRSLEIFSETLMNDNRDKLAVKSLLHQAKLLFKIQQFRTATEKLSQALSIEPNNVELFCQRGLCNAYLFNSTDALLDIHHALRIDSTHLDSLLNSVIIYTDLFNDTTKAEISLRIAAEHYPNHPRVIGFSKALDIDFLNPKSETSPLAELNIDSLFMLGKKAHKNSRKSDALKYFDYILSIDGDHFPTLLARGILLKDLIRPSDAKIDLERYLSKYPNDVQALTTIAACYCFEKDYANALSIIEVATKISPGSIPTKYLLVTIYERLGNTTESLRVLDDIVNMIETATKSHGTIVLASPMSKNFYSKVLTKRAEARYKLLGGVRIRPQDLEQIISEIKLAVDCCNTDSYSLNALAGMCLAAENTEDAERYASQSLNLNPNNSDALLTMARIHRKKKSLEKAKEFIYKFLALRPNNIFAHYHLVGILLDYRDFPTAIETLDKIMSMHKDDRLPPVKVQLKKMIRAQYIVNRNISNQLTK